MRATQRLLLLLCPLISLGALAMDVYIPVIPSMTLALSSSPAMIQWTLSAFMISFGVGQLLFGPWADKVGRRPVALVGMILFILASLGCSFADSAAYLIFWRALQGSAASACSVVSFAVVRDKVEVAQQPAVYAALMASVGVAPLLGPIIGNIISECFGTWKSVFVFLGLIGLLNFFSLLLFFGESLSYEKRLNFNLIEVLKRYKAILSDGMFFRSMFAVATHMAALFCFFSIAPFVIIGSLGKSPAVFSFCFGMNALLCTASNMTASRLLGRINAPRCIFMGLTLMLLGSVSMFFLNYVVELSLMSFLFPQALITFGVGFVGGPASAQAVKAFPHMAGSASALLGACQFTIAGAVGFIMMCFDSATPAPLAMTLMCMSLLSLWLLRGLKEKGASAFSYMAT